MPADYTANRSKQLEVLCYNLIMNALENIIPNPAKAIFLAKRALPELVYDAVQLEGINYTLPEIQTLLDGITVGGHKLSDETITLNQAAAWRHLFKWLEEKSFNLSKQRACELHAIASREEALQWGQFRTGQVTIAGTDYQPPFANELDQLWQDMLDHAESINGIYPRAIFIFLTMARNQFFYDTNKRMGRLLMNGIILQAGYPAINLPANKQTEFNRLMLEFYADGDTAAMTNFMINCLDQRLVDIMSET